MDSQGTPIKSVFSIGKTLTKGAAPFSVIVVVEVASAILSAYGITIDKSILYAAATAGYGTIAGLINYIKNRKK